jgi:hypothetical protein
LLLLGGCPFLQIGNALQCGILAGSLALQVSNAPLGTLLSKHAYSFQSSGVAQRMAAVSIYGIGHQLMLAWASVRLCTSAFLAAALSAASDLAL